MKATMLMVLPFGKALTWTGVLAVVVELAIVVMAARRLSSLRGFQQRALQGDWSPFARFPRPSRLPEIVATALPLAVLAIAVASIQASRGLIRQAYFGGGTDLQARAQLLSEGVGGELNGMALGLTLTAVLLNLGAFAVGLAVAARLRARGMLQAAALSPNTPDVAAIWARYPGPAPAALVAGLVAFVVLGLGPVLRSALLAIQLQVQVFSRMAAEDPGRKPALAADLYDRMSTILAGGAAQARLGGLLATLIAAGLVVATSSERARARALGRPAPSPGAIGGWILAAVFGALALGLFLVARPLARENATPWLPPSPQQLMTLDVTTPDLDGPDPLERAPVVVASDRLILDGSAVDAAELGRRLTILATNYGLLHPDRPFPGRLVLACGATTPPATVEQALAAALAAGYQKIMLTFQRPEAMDRPLLGQFKRQRSSAAHLQTFERGSPPPEDATVVDPARHPTCAALSAEVVSLRRQGKAVALPVKRP